MLTKFSSKVSIAIELLTRKYFLQYYIEYIIAFQQKSGAKSPIPLAIMVSDDTHDLTVKLLEEHNYFGMPKTQLTIMKQEKVPALLDNMAHFAQITNSLLVDTKPHGHGDVHTLLYMTGLAKKMGSRRKKMDLLVPRYQPISFQKLSSCFGSEQKV
jgi:UDP-sugar pyrophosphorylase